MSRIAWVTGGSRGIGRATALRLARDGMDVAVGYNQDAAAAQEVVRAVEEVGRRALAVVGDMGDPEAVGAAHRSVRESLGPVDVLVLNHGIYTRSTLEGLDLETWQRTLDVNLTGPFVATQEVLPAMRERRWGRIIYVGSIRGRTGSTHGAHYAATKAALLGFCRSVANEVAADGITANLVAPGMIDTDIIGADTPEERAKRESMVPTRRVGLPEEIAAGIAHLVSDDAAYVTGTELRIDGGLQMG